MWFVLLDKAVDGEYPFIRYEMHGPFATSAVALAHSTQQLRLQSPEDGFTKAMVIESQSAPLWYVLVDRTQELFGPFLEAQADQFILIWDQINPGWALTKMNVKDAAPVFRAAAKQTSKKH